MSHRSPIPAVLCLLACLALPAFAGDFWVDKPHDAWTEKDVKKLMSSSPWAKSTAIRLSTQDAASAGFEGEEQGEPVQDNASRAEVTILWSGKMVRKAQVRRRHLGGAAPDAAADTQYIDGGGSPDSYLVVVQAPGLAAMKGATEADLAAAGVLRVGKKKAAREVKPTKVVKPADAGGFVAIFQFPRSEAIAEADGEVTFETKLGKYPVDGKFSLADMKVGDGLDL